MSDLWKINKGNISINLKDYTCTSILILTFKTYLYRLKFVLCIGVNLGIYHESIPVN